MIDAAKIEELRGLLAADTSTDWQTIRADPAEGADVWWICAKNAAGQEVELGSLQGGFPHPTREARARLIVAALQGGAAPASPSRPAPAIPLPSSSPLAFSY